jgi:hypothetical protein
MNSRASTPPKRAASMSASDSNGQGGKECHRCVVVAVVNVLRTHARRIVNNLSQTEHPNDGAETVSLGQ